MSEITLKIFKMIDDNWVYQCMGLIYAIDTENIIVEDYETLKKYNLNINSIKTIEDEEEEIVIISDDKNFYALCFESEETKMDIFVLIHEEYKNIKIIEKELDNSNEDEKNKKEKTVGIFTKSCASKDIINNTENDMIEMNEINRKGKISKYLSENYDKKKKESIFLKKFNDTKLMKMENLNSVDTIKILIKKKSLPLVKFMLEHRDVIFKMLNFPFINEISIEEFFIRFIYKIVEEEDLNDYKIIYEIILREHLLKQEALIEQMSDQEIMLFLEKCYSTGYIVGTSNIYMKRIRLDNLHLPETFYYYCSIYKDEGANVEIVKIAIQKILDLLKKKDELENSKYLFEGLNILLEKCSGITANLIYMELDTLFGNIKFFPEIQRFFLGLLKISNYRIREIMINTNILKDMFGSGHLKFINKLFVAKIIKNIAFSECKYLQEYFIEEDLLSLLNIKDYSTKNVIWSILKSAYNKSCGSLRNYLDKYFNIID